MAFARDIENQRKLAELIEKRQRFATRQYKKLREEEIRQEQYLKDLAEKQKTPFWKQAIGGAATGALTGLIGSGFNPLGALAGAGLGVAGAGLSSLTGQQTDPYLMAAYQSYARRQAQQPLQQRGQRLSNVTGRFS